VLYTKATDTHSECVMLIASPLQQWLHNAPQCYLISTFCVLFIILKLPDYWRILVGIIRLKILSKMLFEVVVIQINI
jgi:hypothetical protein